MKYHLLCLCLMFTLNVFPQAKNDSTQIIKLLKDDYSTMLTNDIKKHKANCTDDYLLVEDGEIWDMAKEEAYYKSHEGRVIERTDNFDFKQIKILGNTAYTVYNLKSDIKSNGELIQKNWNESVIFRKINGEWKIALIHSTPAKS